MVSSLSHSLSDPLSLSLSLSLSGWDKTVHAHLVALASNPVETLWPRDTLFK